MNKIMFQIGLLVFCMSVVYFGMQGFTALEMVARSFLVFMIAMGGLVIVALVVTSMMQRRAVGGSDAEAGSAASAGGNRQHEASGTAGASSGAGQ